MYLNINFPQEFAYFCYSNFYGGLHYTWNAVYLWVITKYSLGHLFGKSLCILRKLWGRIWAIQKKAICQYQSQPGE